MDMKKFFTLICLCLSSSVFSQSYETVEVFVQPYTDTIERSGKLDFKKTVILSFKTNGYLNALHVDAGDAFDSGQLLASLDTTELLAEKNSRFAQLMQSKREVNRIRTLLEKELSSQQELDQATTQVETNRSAYQVAYYNLEKAQILAPYDGVVLQRFTDLGELQSPGREVLTVAALQNNWVVKVALTGEEISQVSLNQKVKVRLPKLGVVEGEVNRIPAIASTDGNLFIIDILLPQLSLTSGVIAGQLADIQIDISSNDLVYQLPIDALIKVDEQGKAIVMTEKSNNFEYHSFDIYKVDNNHVYLRADEQSAAFEVVKTGWQHLQVK